MTTKCQKGYRYQGGKCVRYVTKVRYKNAKLSDSNKIVRTLIIGLLIFLSFLFAINLGNTDVLWTLGFNIVILVISYIFYRSPEYQNDGDSPVGIPRNAKKNLIAVAWGLFFTFGFWIGTKLIPGLSLGVPYLPQAISSSFKAFIVNVISPTTETIFFLGVVYAFIRKLTGKKKWVALTLASLFFAFSHLGAYILGLYQYPSFALALGTFWANISSFFVAFMFNMIAGWFMLRKGVRNLLFGIIFHAGVNIISWFNLAVVFALSIALM